MQMIRDTVVCCIGRHIKKNIGRKKIRKWPTKKLCSDNNILEMYNRTRVDGKRFLGCGQRQSGLTRVAIKTYSSYILCFDRFYMKYIFVI